MELEAILKRIFLVVIATIFLQACAVSKIDPNTLKPDSSLKSTLPFDASLFIYIPHSESNETLEMFYGYGNKHVFKSGVFFKQAVNDTASKYFTQVKNLTLSEDTHYVLKLEGEADVDIVWGVYTGEIKAKLYKATGELVHETVVKGSDTSGIIVDDNAMYNSFADASLELFDEIAKKNQSEIIEYANNHRPTRVVFNKENTVALELISTGSGFIISKAGGVVTNHHVVEDCLNISASLGGEQYDARIKHIDKELDLAILETDLIPSHFASIYPSSKKIKLGEDIITVGFPLHGVLASSASLTTGNVSSLAGLQDDTTTFQFTAPIQTGNSGGPIINRNGEVIGVVQSKLNTIKLAKHTGDIAQNVNFAINGKELIKVLDDSGTQYSVPRRSKKAMKTTDIADEATKYTVQIMCKG